MTPSVDRIAKRFEEIMMDELSQVITSYNHIRGGDFLGQHFKEVSRETLKTGETVINYGFSRGNDDAGVMRKSFWKSGSANVYAADISVLYNNSFSYDPSKRVYGIDRHGAGPYGSQYERVGYDYMQNACARFNREFKDQNIHVEYSSIYDGENATVRKGVTFKGKKTWR